MTSMLIEVELEIPQEEFVKLKKLSDLRNEHIADTFKICMFEKCDEYLDMYENNVPTEEEEIEQQQELSKQTTERTKKGTSTEDVPDTTG